MLKLHSPSWHDVQQVLPAAGGLCLVALQLRGTMLGSLFNRSSGIQCLGFSNQRRLQVIPVEPPWQLRGTVVKGFGRGSKELGIPTANLDSASLQSALAEAVTGIYCGWSSIGNSPEVYPMVSAAAWSTLQASWRCATRAGCQATMRLPASKPPSSCMLVCLNPARGTAACG